MNNEGDMPTGGASWEDFSDALLGVVMKEGPGSAVDIANELLHLIARMPAEHLQRAGERGHDGRWLLEQLLEIVTAVAGKGTSKGAAEADEHMRRFQAALGVRA